MVFSLRLPPDELARVGPRSGFARAAGVDPEYFATMGIPILRGRGIGATDVRGAPVVAVVGEDFARAAWPDDADPIGRTLHAITDTTRAVVEVTVVGVARAVRRSPLGTGDFHFAYMARRQLPERPGGVLVVRGGEDAASLAPALRALIVQLDPRLPIAAMQTFAQARRAALREYLPMVVLARAAAVLALGLGCLGVYALIAFSVAQRAREVAIRMALGAHASDVTALFLGQGTRLALYGLVLGLPLGMGIRLALANLLGGVGFTVGTAAALGGVAATLLLTAAVGSWLPARRAARVEPFKLLRTE